MNSSNKRTLTSVGGIAGGSVTFPQGLAKFPLFVIAKQVVLITGGSGRLGLVQDLGDIVRP